MARMTQTGALMWRRTFRLFASNGGTLQTQLRTTLVHAAREGFIAPGAAIPSSRWLASTLELSRNTVSLTLQGLCESGTLIAKPRSGYLLSPKINDVKVSTRQNETCSAEHELLSVPGWTDRTRLSLATLRNIDKPSDWQQYPYPFIYGQPDAELFPIRQWRKVVLASLSKSAVANWSLDAIDQDNEMLVEEIQRRLLPARGISCSRDCILVTAGAQHANYMLANLLMSQDNQVGIENPGYADARNTFRLHTDRLVSLPIDEDGLVISEALDQCQFIYVTPSHQCPTTVTMPLSRRLALLERASHADFVLIEDDHESELNRLGAPTPALKSLDAENRVIYVGSLSKTLAHGLRLGYVVAHPVLIAQLRKLRRLMMRHPAANNAYAAALFIRDGHHEDYVRQLNRVYAERYDAARDALHKYLPQARHAEANGGSALWLQLPEGTDTMKLKAAARHDGIIIEPGEVFFGDAEPPGNYIRLGYSSIDSTRIPEGIKLLARIIDRQ